MGEERMAGEVSPLPSLTTLGLTGLVAAAFDEAWARVEASGSPYATEPYVTKAQDALLRRIVVTHQNGERSKARLVEEGVSYVATLRLRRG
jgi:hypothetical protein